ncbi:MAG TPA: hypothetical protein DFR83_10340 [Deltaproteobacteria bacterium]|nr:hypothetical protein [Deltaproteobacteria bacterium]
MLVLVFFWTVLILGLALRFPGQLPTLPQLGMGLGAWFGTQWLLFSIQEATLGGQTLGKRFMGIRVINAKGGPVTPGQVLVRNLCRPIDNLPCCFALGTILVGVSERALRLGDRLASTQVVHEERSPTMSPQLDLPADATPAERALIQQWFVRASSLVPDARDRLTPHFEAWVARRWPDRLDRTTAAPTPSSAPPRPHRDPADRNGIHRLANSPLARAFRFTPHD